VAVTDVFTLGYEKRSLDEFLRLLRKERIDLVVDVRDVPWSHKPGFSKRPLSEALAAARLEYVHAGFAGNPKALRSTAADNAEALRLYAKHLKSHPEILARMDALLDPFLAKGKRACLICFERDPRDCHRSILATAWAKRRKVAVRHLGLDPLLV
jgi:uncharacterized protein (DUF488 family)